MRQLHWLPQQRQDSGLPPVPQLPRPEEVRGPRETEEGLCQEAVRGDNAGKCLFH